MKKIAIAAFTSGILIAGATPAWAGRADAAPSGLLCGFTSLTDPGAETGTTQTGEISGGPMLADGTLACTIQVGSSRHLDRSNDAVSENASGTTVVALTPTFVMYTAGPDVPVYLCTEFRPLAGSSLYWDAERQEWSTDSLRPCQLSITASTSDPLFAPVPPTESLLLADFGEGDSENGGRIYATCQAGPGITPSPDSRTTWVVRGSAHVVPPAGSTVVATTIACWIRETTTKTDSRRVEGASAFSSAFAVGTTDTGPGPYVMCAEARALFTPTQPPAHYITDACKP